MMNENHLSKNPTDSPAIDTWQVCMARLLNGLPIEVDPRDLIGSHILAYGAWEMDTVTFMQDFLQVGMTIIDVGANIGQHSMIASTCVGQQGQVHAFEPHPGLFDIFNRNIQRAACKNIVPNQLALGHVEGQRLLYPHTIDNLGATSFIPATPGAGGDPVVVNVIKLDHYVMSHDIKQVDFIKIDVEGAELEVLQGTTTILESNPEIVLLVEFYEPNAARFGHHLNNLEAKLRSMGFHLFSISPQGIAPYQQVPDLCQNVIAVRQLPILLQCLKEKDAASLLMRLAQSPAR